MSRPRPEERVCPPGWTSTSRKTSKPNRSGKEVVILKPGMKLVQGLVMPVFYTGVEVLESEAELFPQSTERGVGGFGSTGE